MSNKIADIAFLLKAVTYVAPLYLYDVSGYKNELLYGRTGVEYNFDDDFIDTLVKHYNNDLSKEDIFYYIYAILYSNIFTETYESMLKVKTPNIPFVSNYTAFKALANKGRELAEIHLLTDKAVKFLEDIYGNEIYYFGDIGMPTLVEKISYDGRDIVVINTSNGRYEQFVGIKPEIWNFVIGAAQVLKNYLNSRKNQSLDKEDKKHFVNMARAIRHTFVLQDQIDELYVKYNVDKNAISFKK